MTQLPPTVPPPGWYPDPAANEQQRWWSGESWTEYTSPYPQPAPTYAPAVAPIAPLQNSHADAQPKKRRGFFDSPFEPVGTTRNTAGTLSLVLALVPLAIPIFLRGQELGPLILLGCSIAAVVLGIVGTARARGLGARRGTAIAGIVIGSIILLVTTALLANTVAATEIDAPRLETQIVEGIRDQTGEIMTVNCPANPSGERGATFTCVARDADGVNWMIDVVVQDDVGSAVWYFAG